MTFFVCTSWPSTKAFIRIINFGYFMLCNSASNFASHYTIIHLFEVNKTVKLYSQHVCISMSSDCINLIYCWPRKNFVSRDDVRYSVVVWKHDFIYFLVTNYLLYCNLLTKFTYGKFKTSFLPIFVLKSSSRILMSC